MSLLAVRTKHRARPSSRRLPRWAIVACGIAVGIAVVVIFGSSVLNVYRLQREEARLEALKRNLQEQNAALREEMRLLQTPQYIEKLAREQLGLVKPGEVSLFIIQAPARPEPPADLRQDDASWLTRMWRGLTRRLSP